MRAPSPANVGRDDARLRVWNDRPVASSGAYVVYFCQAARRAVDNPALEYAVARANELGLPVVVYEALRADYPFASDRLHAFVLGCARDSAAALARRGIAHGFFLPRTAEEARGVAAKVFARAALVVSDEHPSFLFPRQNARAAAAAPCAYVTVDDCAVVPLSRLPAHEAAARTIRPKILKLLDQHLARVVEIEPRRHADVEWPFAPLDLGRADLAAAIAGCAIDHGVRPIADRPGGDVAAEARLASFLARAGRSYDRARDDVPADDTSGLSPYLHFGAISARRCALAVREATLPAAARDAFLEQLVVRRALAFNHAAREARHASFQGLPAWARETLAAHAGDERPEARDEATLEAARGPDPVWNAAQRELVARGRVHNVMRMYWGKRLLALLPTPERAFAFGVRMMDRYALDGRDPNTYAGVGWCFGLHDQPFPERPIFGKVRPMGLGALRKRFDVEAWVRSVGQGAMF